MASIDCVCDDRRCAAEGQAKFKVNGLSLAEAEATALSEAFGSAYVTAKTCHKCEAAAEVIVESISEIVLKASLEVEYSLTGHTDGEPISALIEVAERDFHDATISAIVDVRTPSPLARLLQVLCMCQLCHICINDKCRAVPAVVCQRLSTVPVPRLQSDA